MSHRLCCPCWHRTEKAHLLHARKPVTFVAPNLPALDQAPEDLVQQMSLAYGHVKDVLSQFDANMDNIVDETWFVTDIDDCMAKVEELFAERQRLYGKAPAGALPYNR